jgi:DNA-binding GntR family transcriptional regulator
MAVMRADSPLRWDHGLRRQAIVESILADVFQGRLRAGHHLVTQELATRFGVSHTPIREALIALAGLGFIELKPNRGAVVRKVAPREVREICQVRRALECEAVRLACGRMSPAVLDGLTQGFERQMTLPESERANFVATARSLDSRLHDSIASASGNAFLAHELSRLKILFRVFRDVSWEHDGANNEYRRLADESHEHLAIVRALNLGDRREAARAMAHHIQGGSVYWSRVLQDAHPNDGPPDAHPGDAAPRDEAKRRETST